MHKPLLLAPMEGLLDHVLRDVLTRAGAVDRCVAEFIRVTGTLLPERVFLRTVPELAAYSRTPAGVPVRVQLLGSDPHCLADNAARVAALGAEGVDINFGCPAKVVNRHGGGAALLREPERLFAIMRAVRAAVPVRCPVSAKMRLGYDDPHGAVACAQALAAGGAGEIVVHARTKADGYRPPAYWHHVAAVREAVPVPVVANGEIWTLHDALRCRADSGCDALMLGRGIVADPGLALTIRAWDLGGAYAVAGLGWPQIKPLVVDFWHIVCTHMPPHQRAGRLKQWLNLLRRRHPEAEAAFAEVRGMTQQTDIAAWVVSLAERPVAACSGAMPALALAEFEG